MSWAVEVGFTDVKVTIEVSSNRLSVKNDHLEVEVCPLLVYWTFRGALESERFKKDVVLSV